MAQSVARQTLSLERTFLLPLLACYFKLSLEFLLPKCKISTEYSLFRVVLTRYFAC